MPYGIGKPEPGLLLVKDDGIYLMSNGTPHQESFPEEKTKVHVVYAHTFGPLQGDLDSRSAQYDRIREAVGGDDFAEFVPLSAVSGIGEDQQLEISLTPTSIKIDVLRGRQY